MYGGLAEGRSDVAAGALYLTPCSRRIRRIPSGCYSTFGLRVPRPLNEGGGVGDGAPGKIFAPRNSGDRSPHLADLATGLRAPQY